MLTRTIGNRGPQVPHADRARVAPGAKNFPGLALCLAITHHTPASSSRKEPFLVTFRNMGGKQRKNRPRL